VLKYTNKQAVLRFGCLNYIKKKQILQKVFCSFAKTILDMKKLITILSLALAIQLQAQNYDIITAGSISDVQKITEAYSSPLLKGFGYAGSTGTINFSKSKHKISFNLGMSISAALTPKYDRTYDINDLDLEEIQASDPTTTIAQTISGSSDFVDLETKTTYYKPSLNYPFYKEVPIATFASPKGSNVPITPYPIISAGIYGYGTHINFRLLPNFNFTDKAKTLFYGFNIQHNFEEFIPKLKEWPVKFALSMGYEYTEVEYYLEVEPDETKFGLEIGDHNGPYDNQLINVDVTSIPMQLVAYHDFSGLTLYGGIGYNVVNTNTALKGNFPVYVKDPTDSFKLSVNDISDPFAYSRDYSAFRFDLGLNYQIGFMKLMASYTYSKYQVFHFGLGVQI